LFQATPYEFFYRNHAGHNAYEFRRNYGGFKSLGIILFRLKGDNNIGIGNFSTMILFIHLVQMHCNDPKNRHTLGVIVKSEIALHAFEMCGKFQTSILRRSK
jgi:hypothetical protein